LAVLPSKKFKKFSGWKGKVGEVAVSAQLIVGEAAGRGGIKMSLVVKSKKPVTLEHIKFRQG
jgi:hypothetical protein